MIGLQELTLQNTEPDFNLIEPRSIDREPIELHGQFSIRLSCQFLSPGGELDGGHESVRYQGLKRPYAPHDGVPLQQCSFLKRCESR